MTTTPETNEVEQAAAKAVKATKRPPSPKKAPARSKAPTQIKETAEELVTPLEKLKAQAQLLDISFRDDITENALRKIIIDALAQADTGEVITNTSRQDLKLKANKLVRCIISPNSPQQKEYQGQLFSVGNSVVGTIAKFVAFNVEYHVPQIIFDHIEQQQLQFFVSKKSGKNTVRVPKLRAAYSITVLDDLTEEELEELRANQLARQGMED